MRQNLRRLNVQVTLCDHRDAKGEPCGERASVLVKLTMDSKNYECDLCEVHGKTLTANAREASSSIRENVTRLPRVEAPGRKPQTQLVEKVDYVDLRNWLEAQG